MRRCWQVADNTWDKKARGLPEGAGKEAALKALQNLAPDQAKVALTTGLSSSNADVKAWAVRQLAAEGKK